MRFIAYLDANSGSMIMAAVAGGLAGIAVLVKVWWRRFTGLFSPRRRAEVKAPAAADATDAATATNAPDAAPAAAQAPTEK